jgi:aminoglycoside phosphotransferase (APT) family kinase protein
MMSDAESGERGQPELDALLRRTGVLGEAQSSRWTALAGGVSSEIWCVELPDRKICVKRARAKLVVAADWYAPVGRSAFEVRWLKLAARIHPGSVPRILAELSDEHLFVMEYLEPGKFPVWKAELAAGHVDSAFAGHVGDILGEIHAATAGNPVVRQDFASDDFFYALRIEPYLEATARAHPDLASEIGTLAKRTANTRLALVHGDVSPKNILVGPDGPLFLDAETAWYGDPAFDLAFCLNHLLLKCVGVPEAHEALLQSFDSFVHAYDRRIDWEPRAALEARVATLLPALLLARIDGKSPVEYLTRTVDKDRVRKIARGLLKDPRETLAEVRDIWRDGLNQGGLTS